MALTQQAHAQVVQQRIGILMDAFNNPMEAFLEYEPWTVSTNKEEAFGKANTPAQDLENAQILQSIRSDPNKLLDVESTHPDHMVDKNQESSEHSSGRNSGKRKKICVKKGR